MKSEHVETLKYHLSRDIVNVIFQKKDGSERTMRCTLSDVVIPEEKKPKGTGRASSDEVLPVFDIDIMEWRSFRLDSVKSWSTK